MFATLSNLVVNIICYLYSTQIEQTTRHTQGMQHTQSTQPIYTTYMQTENVIHLNEKDLFENLEPDDIDNVSINIFPEDQTFEHQEPVHQEPVHQEPAYKQKEQVRKAPDHHQVRVKLNFNNNNNRNMLLKHTCCLCKKIIDLSPTIYCVNDKIYCSNHICAQIYRAQVAQIFK